MRSPFPGMDPYLENPGLWPGIHQRLITYMGDALQPALGERYVAQIGERVYIASAERGIYPDIAVIKIPGKATGTSIDQTVDEPMVVTLEETQAREVNIEILDLHAGNRVVTIIEVLSPSNKHRYLPGYELYRRKQAEILESPAHLVEIDLLRDGEHTVAVDPHLLLERRPYHYLVCLSRGDDRLHREVWASHLRQRLPRIRIPLVRPDPDVAIDLQALLDQAYANGAYARRIDYSRPPAPPLAPGDEEWVMATAVRK